ncbi:MAG TPA: peptidoglycan-binding protein [Candidatus Paceibacterota bacterium]|nr:peptidoglycan-binding protein [Candidatus Paceibacterota bacterium]
MTKIRTFPIFLCLCIITAGAGFFVFNGISRTRAQDASSSSSSSPVFSRNLSIGDTGPDVALLQTYLIGKDLLPSDDATGYFGPLTESAVEQWQTSVNVSSTGYFGPLSRAAIDGAVAPAYARDLSIGDTGPDVSLLQNYLISKGYLSIESSTGYFGPLTEAAVVSWQIANNIPGTGYFGPLSRAAISLASSTPITPITPVTSVTTPAVPVTITVPAQPTPPVTITVPPATVTPLPSSSPATPLNGKFGLSVGDSLLGLSPAALNNELDGMASLGVGWVRFDMEWDDVQHDNSSTFNWTDIDPVVAALNAHHIKILAILDYTPVWAESSTCAQGSNFCAPSDPALFATFAQAAVQRYAPQGVSDWEIWNEPNNAAFWGPRTNCNAYTALLKDAYTVIKSVQPSSTVITGGLSPAATDGTNMSPPDFLSCIYAAGGGGYFDAVGDHPYTFPQMPSDDNGGAWDQMSATTPNLRSIMTANGDAGKQIWVTEFGVPTDGPDAHWYVSEAQQAQMVTDAFMTYSAYPWGGPFFWYTYKDGGTSTDTNENFFGLLRADGSTKPAYQTLQNLLLQGR